VIILPETVMVTSTYVESKERINKILLLVALAGSTAAVRVAIIVALEGTFTGLTSPSPTPPAMSELKENSGVLLFFVQLSTPNKRKTLIKLKNRDTMRLFIFIEINGKGRHLFQNR